MDFNHRVKLEDPDSDDEEDNCTLVIGVIQKHRRKIKKLGAQNLTIGFSIYKVYIYIYMYVTVNWSHACMISIFIEVVVQ